MSRRLSFVLSTVLACSAVTGFSQETPSGDTLSPTLTGRSQHVVVVMEENRSITQASDYMPYLKSIADRYGQGMQVYSDSHGSWLAYGELTSGLAPFNGQADGGLCNGDGCSQTITIDNLVRHFATAGISWKGYFQGMPSIGYLGYQYGEYVRRHNPFAFYSDVVNDPAQQDNMYPLDPYLLEDIASNNLANFTWISPDLDHDAHNGSDDQEALAAADAYLQTFLPALLSSPPFQSGGDGVLVVTFDEGELSGDSQCGTNPDPNNCGGHVWQVVIGPQVKTSYQSNTHYMQDSQLGMFCDLLGLSSCPGDGATSPTMAEFFQGGIGTCVPNQDKSVAICAPTANGNAPSPVQITAAAKDNQHQITGMVAYANNRVVAQSNSSSLNASVPMDPGHYQLLVRAWDSTGYYFSSLEAFTVAACAPTQDKTVAICSPQANGSVHSPFQIVATATDNEQRITGMVAYANGRVVAQSSGTTLNAMVSLSAGHYQLIVRAWDSTGYYFSSQENFTVQ